MKHIIFAVAVFAFTLAACSKEEPKTPAASTSAPAQVASPPAQIPTSADVDNGKSSTISTDAAKDQASTPTAVTQTPASSSTDTGKDPTKK